MVKKEKSKMEKALLECLEYYRILYFDDILRQEGFDGGQPVLEKKRPVPSFDEADYLKRYGEEFSVYFANETVRKEFIEKKFDQDVAEVEEANRRIDVRNEKRLAEWRKKLSKKSFGEINEVERLFRQYANKEADGVIWFFLKVIRNIPHDFFYNTDFQCSYDNKNYTLKIHFVFPNKLPVFVSQDEDRPINSIHDPSFERYYFGILILIIRNLFNAVYKNDLENAVEKVHVEGCFSNKDDSRSESTPDKQIFVSSYMDSDSLKKIHDLQPEDLFNEEISTFEIHPNDVQIIPEEPDVQQVEEDFQPSNEGVDEPVESYEAFEKKVLKGLEILSEIKEIILREDYHIGVSKSFEYPEKTEQIVDETSFTEESEQSLSEYPDSEEQNAAEFYLRVDELSEPLMSVFLKILRTEPSESHPLESLEASKLNILNLVNNLVYQGRPLIRLSGYEWDEFSWGEEFPDEIIDQLRNRYLFFKKRG